MENHATHSKQATVLRSYSTSTYCREGFVEWMWGWLARKHQLVLHSHSRLQMGQCWPFEGDKGQLHVQLAQRIHISHITLGHITPMQSPFGETTTAPKNFSVYGMKTPDGEEKLLGRFFYDNQGSSFQTFVLPEQSSEGFAHVRLKVETNWGNTEYTCVYNFRVHGTPSERTVHIEVRSNLCPQQGSTEGVHSRGLQEGSTAGVYRRGPQQGSTGGVHSRDLQKGSTAGIYRRGPQQGSTGGVHSRGLQEGSTAGVYSRGPQQAVAEAPSCGQVLPETVVWCVRRGEFLLRWEAAVASYSIAVTDTRLWRPERERGGEATTMRRGLGVSHYSVVGEERVCVFLWRDSSSVLGDQCVPADCERIASTPDEWGDGRELFQWGGTDEASAPGQTAGLRVPLSWEGGSVLHPGRGPGARDGQTDCVDV
uniref:SUN domain-containing protein n=1 Tax=Knipowitschia caucasica TaxID=637954 RepID=A0AAV2JN64_KNICA